MSIRPELPPETLSRSAQHAAEARDAAQNPENIEAAGIAGRGLRDSIDQVRIDRARQVAEKMDRKEELYENLGNVARRGSTNIPEGHQPAQVVRPGSGPRPRTAFERLMDWRLERKGQKEAVANTYAYRSKIIHGEDTSVPAPSVRNVVTRKALGAENSDETGVGEAVYANTERLLRGPQLVENGKGPLIRKLLKALTLGRAISGRITVGEAKERFREIGSDPVKHGSKSHRRSRHALRRRTELSDLAVEQPILSRWRGFRRARAERQITRLEDRQQIRQRQHEVDELRRIEAERRHEEAERIRQEDERVHRGGLTLN